MSTTVTASLANTATTDALAERLVGAATGALELFSIHIGRELGLYEALAERPATHEELAARAGIAARYAQEWLEQQAVAGFLHVTGGGRDGDAQSRRYALPAAHLPVFVAADDPAHTAPLADMVAGIAGVLAQLPAAYRTGGGVPYADYAAPFRRGQGAVNRPVFANDLATWLAALPDVSARLEIAGGRVADIGCGEGWSTIALARAIPRATIDAYDSDPASAEIARQHVRDAGLADRVTVYQTDVASLPAAGRTYALALVFEALHDFARPVEALAALRAVLAEGGALLLGDERVADRFTAPGDDVERLMYGWSVTHCLPASLAETHSAGLGTVLRSDTVRALAASAGFRRCTDLPLENGFFRFYRIDP